MKSLTIAESDNILISGLSTVNSEGFHISIFGSNGVTVQGAKITALSNSPNTDGIHIQMSSDVIVTSSSIKTGDDCTSIGEGTSNVWIEKINCGTSHGIRALTNGSEQRIEKRHRRGLGSDRRVKDRPCGAEKIGANVRAIWDWDRSLERTRRKRRREEGGESESSSSRGGGELELGEEGVRERRGRRRGRVRGSGIGLGSGEGEG
uniref:Polygalacturonase n=1 Tax=Ananas comosus var. bracteatus TaxID=296719 RepID=A0A6V7QHL3_ANACO|nr:unnamed protein product [Ananas comosus var. bracteatus]